MFAFQKKKKGIMEEAAVFPHIALECVAEKLKTQGDWSKSNFKLKRLEGKLCFQSLKSSQIFSSLCHIAESSKQYA